MTRFPTSSQGELAGVGPKTSATAEMRAVAQTMGRTREIVEATQRHMERVTGECHPSCREQSEGIGTITQAVADLSRAA